MLTNSYDLLLPLFLIDYVESVVLIVLFNLLKIWFFLVFLKKQP